MLPYIKVHELAGIDPTLLASLTVREHDSDVVDALRLGQTDDEGLSRPEDILAEPVRPPGIVIG